MFQKQSPSSVTLKRCLSFLKNTSGDMLLEFLKSRYIVRSTLLFLLSSQRNSLLLHEHLVFFLFAMSETPSQRAWMHLICISETSHTASQRRLKEG